MLFTLLNIYHIVYYACCVYVSIYCYVYTINSNNFSCHAPNLSRPFVVNRSTIDTTALVQILERGLLRKCTTGPVHE